MPYRDLDEFLIRLEQENQLLYISTPVSADLEIAEIVNRVQQLPADKNKALLFENVEGSAFPLVVNLFGTEQRMAWALGVESLAELTPKLGKLLDLRLPTSMGEIMARAGELLGALRSAGVGPNRTRIAPVQEIVITENPDVTTLPALKCWPEETGYFLPLTQVITHDPTTGARNVGMYRAQILDKNSLALHFPPFSGGRHHLELAKAVGNNKLPVAIVLGGDPAAIFSSLVPMPPGMDEYMLAGWLRGRTIEYAKCLSHDLEIPANAEIVIEGWIDPAETVEQGQFGGDHGYYTPTALAAVMRVSAITHRKKALLPTLVPGRHSADSKWLHMAVERLLLPILKLFMSEICDIHYPQEGAFRSLAIVSIKKHFEGQAQKVMYGLWGFAPTMLTKTIIVVDDDVDVRDYAAVAARVYENVIWGEDVLTIQGVRDQEQNSNHIPDNKTGIAATRKSWRSYPIRQQPAPLSAEAKAQINALAGTNWTLLWSNTLAIVPNETERLNLLADLAAILPDHNLILLPIGANPHDLSEIAWRMLTEWDWSLGHVEYFGAGIRIDLTARKPDAPAPLAPDPAIQKRVSQKWLQYGIE